MTVAELRQWLVRFSPGAEVVVVGFGAVVEVSRVDDGQDASLHQVVQLVGEFE